MRYYKTVNDGYIVGVGTGNGGTGITEAEYMSLLTMIRQRPQDTATTGYRLTTDLTWEPYARELPDQDDDELTAEEIAEAIEEALA